VCGPGARGALTRDPTHASAHHGAMPSPQEPEERSQSVWAHVLRPEILSAASAAKRKVGPCLP